MKPKQFYASLNLTILKVFGLMFCILFSNTGLSQDYFTGTLETLDSTDTQTLNQKFQEYTTFQLDPAEMNHYIKSQGTSATIHLGLGNGTEWELYLEENEIRSDSYIEIVTSGNEREIFKKGECNTYKGYVDGNPEQELRLTISENYFGGFIYTGEDRVYFESVKDNFEVTQDYENVFITYKRKDAVKPPFTCGHTNDLPPDTGEIADDRDDCFNPVCSWYNTGDGIDPSSAPNFVDKTRYLELAVELDCEFFAKHGGEDGARLRVLNHINQIDKLYRDAVNLHIILVFLHMWEPINGSCLANPTEPDPYTGGLSESLWDQIHVHWNQNFSSIQRDHVHFFSGKNLGPDGTDGGTGVFNAKSGLCGDLEFLNIPAPDPYWANSYTVGEDGWETGAHEIGHALGMTHFCGCGLMETNSCENCSPTSHCISDLAYDGDPADDSSAPHYEMCNWLNSNGADGIQNDLCLLAPPVYDYDFNMVISIDDIIISDLDPIVCVGEEVEFEFFNTFDDLGHTWELGPGLNLIEGDLNDPIIKVLTTANTGSFVTVTFFYNGMEVTYTKSFVIGPPGGIMGPHYLTPVFGTSNPIEYDVHFFSAYGAEFYDFDYTIFGDHGGPLSGNSGTTTQIAPFVTLDGDNCMIVDFIPGNECGLSPNTFTIEICPPGYSGLPPSPLIIEEGDLKSETGKTLTHNKDFSGDLNFTEVNMETEKRDLETQVHLYPNPAEDAVNIILPDAVEAKKIIVFDPTGKLVFETKKLNRKTTVFTNEWAKGTYIFKIFAKDGLMHKKVLIH